MLSGSIDCLAASNRICHQVYDLIADPDEFWVTALIHYIVALIPTIVAILGVKLRRDKQ